MSSDNASNNTRSNNIQQSSNTLISSNENTAVNKNGPLNRLNYFDGKFLRAQDLKLEQQGLVNQARLANQSHGSGIIHGYDVSLQKGDSLLISPGLAFDSFGRALLMEQSFSIGISQLLQLSHEILTGFVSAEPALQKTDAFGECPAAPQQPDNSLPSSDYYLITLNHFETYCGEEDVYGALCSEACITSKARSHIVEGLRILAQPISVGTLKQSQAVSLISSHLRSRVAAAYFEQEKQQPASLIHQAGLQSAAWCKGAQAQAQQAVSIALLARSGGNTLFVDPWISRRERIDAIAQSYWAARMAMRSWRVYLAQILQFQCQLRDVLGSSGNPGSPIDSPTDMGANCTEEKALLKQTAGQLQQLMQIYEKTSARLAESGATIQSINHSINPEMNSQQLAEVRDSLQRIEQLQLASGITQRWLINRGIVELPSAGYLPVASSSQLSVNEQVKRLMGEGLDLQFCVVRPDYVPHALEQAQHMERICLLQGLDKPEQKPKVDILIPDGQIQHLQAQQQGQAYALTLYFGREASSAFTAMNSGQNSKGMAAAMAQSFARTRKTSIRDGQASLTAVEEDDRRRIEGAAREEITASDKVGFYYAGSGLFAEYNTGETQVDAFIDIWCKIEADKNPFSLSTHQSTRIEAELVLMLRLEADQEKGQDAEFYLLMRNFQAGNLSLVQSNSQADKTQLEAVLDTQGFAAKTVLNANNERETTTDSVSQNGQRLRLNKDANGFGCFDLMAQLMLDQLFNTDKNTFTKAELNSRRQWRSSQQADLYSSLIVEGYDPDTQQLASQEVPLISGKFVLNPEVMKAEHRLHRLSLQSLDLMAHALGNPRFADARSRLLFPPPQAAENNFNVFAKHDWVLFQRRREKICQYQSQPQSLPATYRFRVFLAVIQDASPERLQEVAKDLREILNSSSGLSHPELQREIRLVDTVEFDAGLSALRSDDGALLSAWNTLIGNQDNEALCFAAIASESQPFAEGNLLAQQRLNRVINVVNTASPQSENFSTYVHNNLLINDDSNSSDGVIFLFACPILQDAVNTCHQVYGIATANLKNSLASIEEFATHDAQGSLENLVGEARLSDPNGGNFEVVFAGGSDEFAQGDTQIQSLQNAWSASQAGQISHVTSLSPDTGESAISLTKSQALKIANTLGYSNQEQTHFFLARERLSQCPQATFLFYQINVGVAIDVSRGFRDTSSAESSVTTSKEAIHFSEDNELIRDEKFTAFIKDLLSEHPVTKLEIEQVNESDTDSAAIKRAESLLSALKQAKVATAGAAVKVVSVADEEKAALEASGFAMNRGIIFRH